MPGVTAVGDVRPVSCAAEAGRLLRKHRSHTHRRTRETGEWRQMSSIGASSVENDMRPSGRLPHSLRPISIEPGVAKYAEGSCLVRFGDTHVLCTASVEERVPPFLRNTGRGWVTAEYGMLPRSTHTRTDREALQADGGTRTAAVTGSYVALHQAMAKLVEQKALAAVPLSAEVAAISC